VAAGSAGNLLQFTFQSCLARGMENPLSHVLFLRRPNPPKEYQYIFSELFNSSTFQGFNLYQIFAIIPRIVYT
jgi:hypothetical protein